LKLESATADEQAVQVIRRGVQDQNDRIRDKNKKEKQ
jgi:hypothetical protein